MKNSITSKKNTPSTKKGTATPQKEGISFSWVAKNIFAVVIVLFLLNKFVLDVQPGYNWAYNMLQKNLETIRHYSRTTTDNRFEVGSINSIFYFLHKAAEPFNCLEQDNLA